MVTGRRVDTTSPLCIYLMHFMQRMNDVLNSIAHPQLSPLRDGLKLLTYE
jgi:hypothetical protein